jgi:hypothetical protein
MVNPYQKEFGGHFFDAFVSKPVSQVVFMHGLDFLARQDHGQTFGILSARA